MICVLVIYYICIEYILKMFLVCLSNNQFFGMNVVRSMQPTIPNTFSIPVYLFLIYLRS